MTSKVDIDQRKANLELARNCLIRRIAELEAEKREVDDQMDELELEGQKPQCPCGAHRDADCDLRDVQKCIRKEYVDTYGEVDPTDYRMGRGLPR